MWEWVIRARWWMPWCVIANRRVGGMRCVACGMDSMRLLRSSRAVAWYAVPLERLESAAMSSRSRNGMEAMSWRIWWSRWEVFMVFPVVHRSWCGWSSGLCCVWIAVVCVWTFVLGVCRPRSRRGVVWVRSLDLRVLG